MSEIEEYNYQEHLHRYAIWTAARAQRGTFASNILIGEAVKKIDLKEKVFNLPFDINSNQFDHWHLGITRELLTVLNGFQRGEVKFGRAAKIINVYLKTTLVIPHCNKKSELLKNIHPPIDSILLSSLIENRILPNNYSMPWTTMQEKTYLEIISILRNCRDIESLWMIEKYWSSEKDKRA